MNKEFTRIRTHVQLFKPVWFWLGQVRALQENEIVRVGSTEIVKVDVRIIAATHRDLIAETAAGRFRSDLFYRLAVAVLKIPPLRERKGDIGFLIDRLLGQVNLESANEPGYKDKKSPGGRKSTCAGLPSSMSIATRPARLL